MALKKSGDTPQEVAEPVTASAPKEPKAPKAPTALPSLYLAKFRVCNPFQNFYLDEITPKEIKMDNWWECQIKAGIVNKVQ